MDRDFNNCVGELITSEHLNAFSVIEQYCDLCGDLTPHHIEDSKNKPEDFEVEVILVAPMSSHECVYCREGEETRIEEVDS